jgi:ABC-type sugar transport system substrate-binding protein
MARIVASFITEDNDFQLFQAADARQEAARLGLELEVIFAAGNAIQQIQQLFKQIHSSQRPFALIVEPMVDEGMERVARNAIDAGIGWIVLNRRAPYLPELASRRQKLPIGSVSTDQLEVGRLQGRQFGALLPSGGRVLYVQGPLHSSVVRERLTGLRSVLQAKPIDLTLVDADWTAAGAEKAVGSWSRGSLAAGLRIDLVGGQNDQIAVGARKALMAHTDPERRREWAALRYTGVDGLPDGGKRMVDRGQLAATIVCPSNAGPAVGLVARFIEGGPGTPELVLPPASYPPIDRLGR